MSEDGLHGKPPMDGPTTIKTRQLEYAPFNESKSNMQSDCSFVMSYFSIKNVPQITSVMQTNMKLVGRSGWRSSHGIEQMMKNDVCYRDACWPFGEAKFSKK